MELFMTAAELRLEADIDAMNAAEGDIDTLDDYLYREPEPVNPADCEHPGDFDQVNANTAECVWCGAHVPHDWSW